jgi:2-methylcitrate dehydratase PrpD/pimeloyl-ACP methyl ester carboxylesterase
MIHYGDYGSGPPVVLIHAFANDGALWKPQVENLGARFRIITPDLRGFGASMPTDGRAVSMDEYADDVVAVLDHLGIERAAIGGISLGGYVALSIALRHPARVSGLILANTRAGADNPEWASFREALVRDVDARGAAAVVENYGDKPFRKDCPQGIKDYVREMILRQPASGLASGTRGMAQRPDRTPRLAEIRVPTLIISGTEDNYIPSSEGDAMHRGIAGSRFLDIPYAGHLSNIDSADAFNAAVGVFLESVSPSPALPQGGGSVFVPRGGGSTHAAAITQIYESCASRPLSQKALATAKLGIFDIVGCIIGGAATPTARTVRELALEQADGKGVSVLGTRERLPPALAALVNGVAGHVLDYDDMNSTMIAHPSVVLGPAIFALAEARGKSGREIIDAYVVGFEVNGHFGRTMIPHHYDAGWHSTSSLGIFGATAAAARLLDLDAKGALNALAIAASNSAGLRGNFGSQTKALHAGQAAEGAVRAALLSSRGFTGNAEVFDAPGGYFATYGKNDKPRAAPAEGAFEIESSGIGIKPYACCGAGVSVIDAALDIREKFGLSGEKIADVAVVLSPMATSIMPFHEAHDGLQAKYSLAYCASVALLDGKGGLAQFEDERAARPDVRELVKRTRITADPRMVSGAGKFGIHMSVILADGREFSTELETPRGHPTRPLESERQLEKFLECASPVLGERRARDAARQLEALETQSDIAALLELLRPEEGR